MSLRVGDRVRIVRLPPAWDNPQYHVPAPTRRLFRKLMDRGRPLRVREVDERGEAWVWCRFRGKNGRIEHHGITIDDGCWVRVKAPRKRSN